MANDHPKFHRTFHRSEWRIDPKSHCAPRLTNQNNGPTQNRTIARPLNDGDLLQADIEYHRSKQFQRQITGVLEQHAHFLDAKTQPSCDHRNYQTACHKKGSLILQVYIKRLLESHRIRDIPPVEPVLARLHLKVANIRI
jgi:hypothetical protein